MILFSTFYSMKKYLNKLFLTFSILIGFKGICSDSAYIFIGWYGPVDKPYHEFVFYKTGGFNPEQEMGSYYPFEQDPFILQIALPKKSFEDLRQILFRQQDNQDSINRQDSIDRLDPLIGSYYYLVYYEGHNMILSKPLNDKSDFIKLFQDLSVFFKETNHEEEIRQHWKNVLERLGMKPN